MKPNAATDEQAKAQICRSCGKPTETEFELYRLKKFCPIGWICGGGWLFAEITGVRTAENERQT